MYQQSTYNYDFLRPFYGIICCVACIRPCFTGPCSVQQRRRSRAEIQHKGGSRVFYPDHVGSAWVPSVPYAPLPSSQKQVIRNQCGPPPPPPQTNLGKAPSHPLQVHTPPPAKIKIEASLGGNHISASDWGRRPCIGLEEDVETILGFSALLYEVRQLS